MGYKLTSRVIDECCRDSDGKLTRFLTGRRYFFMERPQRPCPDVIQFGLFTGKVYHKEQAYTGLPPDTENTIQPDRPVTFDGSYTDETIIASQNATITNESITIPTNNHFDALEDTDTSLSTESHSSSDDREASDWDTYPTTDPAVSSTPFPKLKPNAKKKKPSRQKTMTQCWPMNDSERKRNRSSPSQGGQNNKNPKTWDTGQYNT